MIDKFKVWLKATGLGNLVWAAGCAGSLLLIGGSLGAFLGGVCAGLFVYFNLDVIKKIIKGLK